MSCLPACAKRDLSSIIHATTAHGLPCPAPTELTSQSCHLIRPGVYHGSGLFPFLCRLAYFIVPNIFTISKGCRRHLTAEETLTALDVSEDHHAKFAFHERRLVCDDTFFLPLKVTSTVLQLLSSLLDHHIGH